MQVHKTKCWTWQRKEDRMQKHAIKTPACVHPWVPWSPWVIGALIYIIRYRGSKACFFEQSRNDNYTARHLIVGIRHLIHHHVLIFSLWMASHKFPICQSSYEVFLNFTIIKCMFHQWFFVKNAKIPVQTDPLLSLLEHCLSYHPWIPQISMIYTDVNRTICL